MNNIKAIGPEFAVEEKICRKELEKEKTKVETFAYNWDLSQGFDGINTNLTENMKRVIVYALATLQILVTRAQDMQQNQNLSQDYLKAK